MTMKHQKPNNTLQYIHVVLEQKCSKHYTKSFASQSVTRQ